MTTKGLHEYDARRTILVQPMNGRDTLRTDFGHYPGLNGHWNGVDFLHFTIMLRLEKPAGFKPNG